MGKVKKRWADKKTGLPVKGGTGMGKSAQNVDSYLKMGLFKQNGMALAGRPG